MNFDELTREEKIEEIKKLRKNLSRRASSIEKLGDSVPQFFTKSFRSTEKQFAGRYSKMSDEQLDKFLRNLRYENRLTSSTVKGAKYVQAKFLPIKEKISKLSKSKQDLIQETFDKIVEETSLTLLDKYRYEVLQLVTNKIYEGKDDEEIINDIVTNFRESYLEGGYEFFELYLSDELKGLF